MAAVDDALAPWLLDFGNWIFSGLVAFDLVILGATLTIVPLDTAVVIATAAMALALPLDVTGFLLLRLGADVRKVNVGEVGTEALAAAGITVDRGAGRDRPVSRARTVIFRYSYAMLVGATLLTFAGLAAALWHVAPWITAAFLVMAAASVLVIVLAVFSLRPRSTAREEGAKPETPDAAGR